MEQTGVQFPHCLPLKEIEMISYIKKLINKFFSKKEVALITPPVTKVDTPANRKTTEVVALKPIEVTEEIKQEVKKEAILVPPPAPIPAPFVPPPAPPQQKPRNKNQFTSASGMY